MAKLLFVDDEHFILMGMERIFKIMADEMDVVFASSGEEALEAMQEHTFDIIISDMYMNGMTGVELLGNVRKLYPNTIRVILSGYLENSLDNPLQEVAHFVLSKPIKSDIFIETIRTCLVNKEQIIVP